ncbi:hypothetical protein D3Z36_01150 [Lachnospiraceae bacterium]|nr:hypothetical protein [Lachnospiraceae bacterium]
MVKSIEESARERRCYIEQARASFQAPGQEYVTEQEEETVPAGNATLGIRLVIAILLFACFVYCDQEKVTFQGIGAQEVVKQIQWKPFPTEKVEELLGNISISSKQDDKKQ